MSTPDTFLLGGDLPVHHLGFGTMRLVGEGAWGEPPVGRPAAIALLRRAVDLDINLLDTADAYGPHIAEDLIAEALHPYPAGLVIATKGGLTRTAPAKSKPLGPPGLPHPVHRAFPPPPQARSHRPLPAPPL